MKCDFELLCLEVHEAGYDISALSQMCYSDGEIIRWFWETYSPKRCFTFEVDVESSIGKRRIKP